MADLVPGEEYKIADASRIPPFITDCAMYVRNERIGGKDWHVFAVGSSVCSLVRKRVPCEDARLEDKTVTSYNLVGKAIMYERDDPQRLPSVNEFLDEAIRLAGEKPAPINTHLHYLHLDLEKLAA